LSRIEKIKEQIGGDIIMQVKDLIFFKKDEWDLFTTREDSQIYNEFILILNHKIKNINKLFGMKCIKKYNIKMDNKDNQEENMYIALLRSKKLPIFLRIVRLSLKKINLKNLILDVLEHNVVNKKIYNTIICDLDAAINIEFNKAGSEFIYTTPIYTSLKKMLNDEIDYVNFLCKKK